jgi:hypothetical protein
MLLPKTEKDVDLGHIIDPVERSNVPDEQNPNLNISNVQTVFYFELTIRPTSRYQIIAPGEYRFAITVGAQNCSPVTRKFYLRLLGYWNNEESVMLSQGIKIIPLR